MDGTGHVPMICLARSYLGAISVPFDKYQVYCLYMSVRVSYDLHRRYPQPQEVFMVDFENEYPVSHH